MKTKYFFLLSGLVCVALAVVVSCSKSSGGGYGNSGGTGGGGGTNTGNNITMSNMTFSPASKTVAKGTVVKWTNNDSYAHTVTSNDGSSFDSGNINGGGSFSYTASTPGTFEYHCTIHGTAMSGTLIVTQ
jgi:plastocyanin